MQKIYMCTTERENLRTEIIGFSYEDGSAVWQAYDRRGHIYSSQNQMPVGLIGGSLEGKFYPTVLHAIGDGWKLLAPPSAFEEQRDSDERGKHTVTVYHWYLVKD